MAWIRLLAASFVVLASIPASAAAGACSKPSAELIDEISAVDDHIVIRQCDGSEVAPPQETDQRGVAQPRVSPKRDYAGWAVLYDNCCTSYAIPLALMIYHRGKTLKIEPPNAPQAIWEWKFTDQGRHIAMRSGPTHGDACVNSTFDAHSGKKISEKDCVDGK